jgi:hypothetical protein
MLSVNKLSEIMLIVLFLSVVMLSVVTAVYIYICMYVWCVCVYACVCVYVCAYVCILDVFLILPTGQQPITDVKVCLCVPCVSTKCPSAKRLFTERLGAKQ